MKEIMKLTELQINFKLENENQEFPRKGNKARASINNKERAKPPEIFSRITHRTEIFVICLRQSNVKGRQIINKRFFTEALDIYMQPRHTKF